MRTAHDPHDNVYPQILRERLADPSVTPTQVQESLAAFDRKLGTITRGFNLTNQYIRVARARGAIMPPSAASWPTGTRKQRPLLESKFERIFDAVIDDPLMADNRIVELYNQQKTSVRVVGGIGRQFNRIFQDAGGQLPYEVTQDQAEARSEIARRKRLLQMAIRPAQREFRDIIFDNYNGRCAVTGCTTAASMEAAHIRIITDADGERVDDNRPDNGILLRADIHALFDALLITLSNDGKRIEISDKLTDATYTFLKGKLVLRPEHGPRPSRKNIEHHRNRFRGRG